jgi:hypothetical protein
VIAKAKTATESSAAGNGCKKDSLEAAGTAGSKPKKSLTSQIFTSITLMASFWKKRLF